MKFIYRLFLSTKEKDAVNRLRSMILLSITYLIILAAGSLLVAYSVSDSLRIMVNHDPRYQLYSALVICSISNLLVRVGRIKQAGMFLALGLIPIIIFDDPSDLVSTTSGAAFLLPIMIIGVSNGAKAITVFTLLCEIIIVLLASIFGWSENTFDILSITFLVAMIFALIVHTMDEALKQMRGKIKLELDLREEHYKLQDAEDKAAFIGSIAHDVRGPIRAVSELINIYKEDPMSEDERGEIITTIGSTLENVYITITDHLRRSKDLEVEKDFINIGDVIARITSSFKGIKFEIANKLEDGFKCRSNLKFLERAFQNILTNSREAGASIISIVIEMIHTDLIVTISDNGPGYPQEILFRGPTHGFTLKREGLGIGLSGMVYNLSKQNIKVLFSNKENKTGAITQINIPINKEESL